MLNKLNLPYNGPKKKYIIIGIILYVLAAGISYLVFSKVVQKSSSPTSPLTTDISGKVAFDENLPKTEACPLNGQMYSKQQRDWWEKHRPLGVMIENHPEARPQSGLSAADIVYEAVAEGSITRFMAIFYCQDGGMVGPVRSARTYFLDYISEYGQRPLYAHVGGANRDGPADALGQIIQYDWVGKNDLNQFSISFPTFWKDTERLTKASGEQVATEHQMYSTTEKLWKVASDRKLTNIDSDGKSWDKTFIPWQFKDDGAGADRGTKSPSFEFWKGYKDFAVKWDYDTATNTYKRINGGVLDVDKDNDKQLIAKNVVVIFTTERSLNDEEKHMLYGTKGQGKALFFFDGNVEQGSWEKLDRASRMKFTDKSGKVVKLDRGQIWIEVLPIGNEVVY